MKKYGAIHLVPRVIVQYVKVSGWFGLLEQTLAMLHGLSWAVGIIATQILFDAIVDASEGMIGFWQVAAPLAVLAAVTFGQQLLNGIENFASSEIEERNVSRYMVALLRKLQRIPAKHFEESAFLDDVNKAREGPANLGYMAFVCLQFVTFYLVFFVAVAAYLFWLSPLLPLVILASFVPSLLGQLAHVKIFAKLEEENAPERRRHDYYKKAIVDREFYKETRILGAFRFFHKLFSESLQIVTHKTWQTERRAALIRLLLNLASFAGLGASLYLLFAATMSGEISAGAFAAVFTSLSLVFSLMDEIVTRHFGSASEHIGKVANYFRVMDMCETGGDYGVPDFTRGIVAKGIGFSYPGQESAAVSAAISNLSLDIKSGETIAIVGENGAGKSTLVRLLSGIYSPDYGSVNIGGLDSKKHHPTGMFSRTSGVFQRYQCYKMTLADNVKISNTSTTMQYDKIQHALDSAEFNAKGLQLDAMLSPEFDGIDLSGGQWQRLAIARGLYRQNDFIVLDEPTAAIDPIEETRIYNQFKELARDKCAIIVTHRLGSARLADRIVVMDKGEIVDIGTHDELIARPGKYADMWVAQASWYVEKTD